MAVRKKLETAEPERNDRQYCHCCGQLLTSDNSREVAKSVSWTGISHLCVYCEEKYYKRLADTEGRHLALFHACAAFDIPCQPIVLDGTDFKDSESPWLLYIDKLAESGMDRRRGIPTTFFDGETDMLRIFGKEFTEKDFSKYFLSMKKKIAETPGTPEQRDKWGKDYTAQEYEELDRLYENRAANFRGQTITPQMDSTLTKVAKWELLLDKYIKNNNMKSARDLYSMIDMALSSEQMRKKDEKPIENFRPDAWITALERAGLMEDGKFLNYDDTVKALRDVTVKSKKYRYSLDVADQIQYNIYNNARKNGDLAIAYDMPEEMELEDEYGEFEEEETEEEIANKKYSNLGTIKYTKSKSAEEKTTGTTEV